MARVSIRRPIWSISPTRYSARGTTSIPDNTCCLAITGYLFNERLLCPDRSDPDYSGDTTIAYQGVIPPYAIDRIFYFERCIDPADGCWSHRMFDAPDQTRDDDGNWVDAKEAVTPPVPVKTKATSPPPSSPSPLRKSHGPTTEDPPVSAALPTSHQAKTNRQRYSG